jgi:hypothetical protein
MKTAATTADNTTMNHLNFENYHSNRPIKSKEPTEYKITKSVESKKELAKVYEKSDDSSSPITPHTDGADAGEKGTGNSTQRSQDKVSKF